MRAQVGPTYAGILGTLAFTSVVFRGLAHGAGIEATSVKAAVCLMVFGAVGYVAGNIAERMVAESAQAKVSAEMAELEKAAVKTAKGRG